MKRREFLGLLGSAVATTLPPVTASAQQPVMPAIGYLSTLSEAQVGHMLAAFRRGLGEVGYVEGRNLSIEFRWAEGRFDRLPAMAAELVRRPVDLLLAQAPPAALAGKAATTTVPIVFVVGFDPVASGLVASLNQPGGNATGLTLMSLPIAEKRLEILRELAPKAPTIAMLVNPMAPDAMPEIRTVQAAAQSLALQLRIFNASTPREISAAFAAMSEQRPGALLVGTDPFFVNQREELVALAARLAVPAIYPFREFTAAGGLVSYGTNIANAYRQAGIYSGRILKGAKPGDLPVMQPTTFELVTNLRTARTLGIEIPVTLHARSDEVIE